MRAWLITIAVLVAPDRVTVHLTPTVIVAGGSVRVTCRVPARPDNRGLYLGIVDYTSHFVQIEGEMGPVTTEQLFTKIPCDTERAFCELVDDHGVHRFAFAPFTVGGCTSQRKP